MYISRESIKGHLGRTEIFIEAKSFLCAEYILYCLVKTISVAPLFSNIRLVSSSIFIIFLEVLAVFLILGCDCCQSELDKISLHSLDYGNMLGGCNQGQTFDKEDARFYSINML